MSEDQNNTPTHMPPPQLPGRAEELFRIVFSPGPAIVHPPAPAVQAEANAYQIYVMQFAQRLEMESRHLAAISRDDVPLGQKAKDLLQVELRRKEALAPYLAGPAPASPAPAQGVVRIWQQLQVRLHEAMTQELEAVRDARLRLEVKRAELINQRATVHARIVLRGGAQIRLHFGRQAGHAAEKT